MRAAAQPTAGRPATLRAALAKRAVWIALALPLALSGCGGADDHIHVIGALDIRLTQVDAEAIQLDWTFDPEAVAYTVVRDGYPLARLDTTSIIDASVMFGGRYCYRVLGRDGVGMVVSESPIGCIVVH